jgi:hypothetical protein
VRVGVLFYSSGKGGGRGGPTLCAESGHSGACRGCDCVGGKLMSKITRPRPTRPLVLIFHLTLVVWVEKIVVVCARSIYSSGMSGRADDNTDVREATYAERVVNAFL